MKQEPVRGNTGGTIADCRLSIVYSSKKAAPVSLPGRLFRAQAWDDLRMLLQKALLHRRVLQMLVLESDFCPPQGISQVAVDA